MLLEPSRWISILAALLCLIGIAIVASAEDEASSADKLYSAAQSRIQQHRRSAVTITLHDATDHPAANAKVRFEQTRHAFLFGSNIFKWGRVGDDLAESEYRRRFADVFNFATLPFYWSNYERQQGQPMYDSSAAIAEWCRQQGIRTKGHPLAWNHSEPWWLPSDVDTVFALQLARIRNCMNRFDGAIDTWDVVNEATHFDRPEFMARSPKYTQMWSEVGQIEFTRKCFLEARKANPKATLLINDYRVDAAYERLIEQLVDDQGKPLYDAIGIQSHQHGGTWSNQKIWDVCERFARFGVPLHFTETTIVSGQRKSRGGGARNEGWATTPEGEALQAEEVERFYTMLYSHPAVEAITWWDFSDLDAWQGAPAGFLRDDMSPKPAYDVLRRLIKDEWWTDVQATTDNDGQLTVNATPGDYRVTIESANGKTVTRSIHVARSDSSQQLTWRLP